MSLIWLTLITKNPRVPPMKWFPQKGIDEEGDDDPLGQEALKV